MSDKNSDNTIFRVFECNIQGNLTEIAFVKSLESTKFYLESSNSHNTNPDTFYFAH
jgi:hypothetical protein